MKPIRQFRGYPLPTQGGKFQRCGVFPKARICSRQQTKIQILSRKGRNRISQIAVGWQEIAAKKGELLKAAGFSSPGGFFVCCQFKACAMEQFFARVNIGHFRDRLSREVNPETRAFLQKLLVEEEDKLGADLESLADVQQHIEDSHHRIERQRALVAIMERYGNNGLNRAKALLDGLLESQLLHQEYHHRILIKISKNQL